MRPEFAPLQFAPDRAWRGEAGVGFGGQFFPALFMVLRAHQYQGIDSYEYFGQIVQAIAVLLPNGAVTDLGVFPC